MTREHQNIAAWLLQPDADAARIEETLHHISDAMDILDPGFRQGRVLTARSACLVTPNHVLWITHGTAEHAGAATSAPLLRLIIHPIAKSATLTSAGALLARLICTLPATQVRWNEHDVWLPMAGFRAAVEGETAAACALPASETRKPALQVVQGGVLPQIDETCELLSARLDRLGAHREADEDVAETPPYRRTAWRTVLSSGGAALTLGRRAHRAGTAHS